VRLCENYAVNAVAAYYYGMAQQSGIETDVSLIVPMELEANVESDLCVVVGNLMENAVEACARMESGRQFIHVGSKLQYGVLTITVDNSFAGAVQKRDKSFLSSKREGEGTGISSVAMVAKRHDGNTRFESKDGMFQASVYLKILKEAE
jgi:sensor histidine kinase YesM